MTASKHVNILPIIILFNRNRSYQSVRAKHHINYNCMTVLLSCYLYSVTVKTTFSLDSIVKYINYLFSYVMFKRYMNSLLEYGLISITQRGNHKLYSLTDSGYSAIQEISDNADRLMYDFCSKYSIEL